MGSLIVLVVVGLLSALVVHEWGHLVCALVCGGQDVRLSLLHVDASFAEERTLARASFFAAGVIANLAAAGALWAVGQPIVAGMHGLVAIVNLAPAPHSDGRRLLALVRAHVSGASGVPRDASTR